MTTSEAREARELKVGGTGAVARGARPGRLAASVRLTMARLLCGTLFVLGWEFVLSRSVDPFFISKPSDIAARLAEWILDGSLWPNFVYTMASTFLGFLVGAGTGVLSGFLLGRRPFLGAVADPFLDAINSLPRVALAPLFTLWLGIDLAPKVLMAASLVFFVVLANTRAGVRDVNPELINVLRVMGADERTILRKVVVPSAAGWIYASLLNALPWALIGAVVGEMIASSRGIGHQILYSGGILDSTGIFAGLVTLMAAGLALTQIVRALERRTQRWRATTGSR